MSAVLAAAITNPLDVCRIHFQAQTATKRMGLVSLVKHLAKTPHAFFRGTFARCIWAAANTGATVALYDVVSRRI